MYKKRLIKILIGCGVLLIIAGIISVTYMGICFVLAGILLLASVYLKIKM